MTPDPAQDVPAAPALADVTLIDQVCDSFEAAWRSGKGPQISDYLTMVPQSLQPRLFEELLLSDLEFHTRHQTAIDAAPYVSQFPDRAAQINSVIEHYRMEHARHRGEHVTIPIDRRCTESSEFAALAAVKQCGNYQLRREIARGGMGVVFEAHDTKLQRTVALKMILDRNLASPEAVQRFYAEAEMAASLNHPGIVPIYDVGSHAGHHYYAMALVEGPTLSAQLRERRYGMEEAAQIVRDLAHAVDYAHDHGVVHRDLKPSNILLPRTGLPQITDFGLAKRTDRAASSSPLPDRSLERQATWPRSRPRETSINPGWPWTSMPWAPSSTT